jgi:endonuclease YncB( thermonuclease family)
MKKCILIVNLLISFIAQAIDSCAHDDNNFRCVKYLKNYDADTITFEIPNVPALIGHNVSIRVRGIDSPEIKSKKSCDRKVAVTARDYVKDLLINAKIINLENIQREKYFRILADVKLDGKDLASDLLSKNLAFPYAGKTKESRDWCSIKVEVITPIPLESERR